MSKDVVLGGGFGCFTWLGVGTVTSAAAMGLLNLFGFTEESLDEGMLGDFFIIGIGLSTLVVSWRINRWLESEWAAEEAEAERKRHEEHARKLEREREYYRQNPERLIWDVCRECKMRIPAFARRCPYCTADLRQED